MIRLDIMLHYHGKGVLIRVADPGGGDRIRFRPSRKLFGSNSVSQEKSDRDPIIYELLSIFCSFGQYILILEFFFICELRFKPDLTLLTTGSLMSTH